MWQGRWQTVPQTVREKGCEYVEKKLKKEAFEEKEELQDTGVLEEADEAEAAADDAEQENEETELEKATREAYEKGVADTEEKFRALEFERRVEEELKKAKPKNLKALSALIDFDSVSLSGGELNGLSEQLEKLRKECDFLFEDEKKPRFTGSVATQEKTDISNLGYKERLKLYKEMPELYKQLVK